MSTTGPIGRTIMASALLVLLAAVTYSIRGKLPADGSRIPPEVESWEANGVRIQVPPGVDSALRSGDLVTAIDGRSMDGWVGILSDRRADRPNWQVGDVVAYRVVRGAQQLDVNVRLISYPWLSFARQAWGALLSELLSFALATFLFAKRPNEPAARALFVASSGILASSSWSLGVTPIDYVFPSGLWTHLISTTLAYMVLWQASLHFALVFPQRHPIVARRRWLLPLSYGLPLTLLGGVFLWLLAQPELSIDQTTLPGRLVSVLELSYLLLTITALVTNYRAAANPADKEKVRLVVFAFALIAVLTIGLGMIPGLLFGRPALSWNWLALTGMIVPLAIVVAILRHRLFDLNLVVNRTLVYGALTLIVVAFYVGFVGWVGAVLEAEGNLLLSLAATGMVAVAVQPMRQWLQRRFNRLMYGDRDDPQRALARLSDRLAATVGPQDVLPNVAETVADALRLPFVGVDLWDGVGFRREATFGRETDRVATFSMTHQGELIGRLIAGLRHGDDGFSQVEQGVLKSLARQASVAAQAVQLNRALQRSREALVLAREEERRRLRRDLHDDLGASLASQALKLEAAEEMIWDDPQAVATMLADLRSESRDTLAEIRRMVQGLRPPALDELGLVPALEAHVAQVSQSVRRPRFLVYQESDLGPLSAAVEAAAYRIAVEAITNVVRHAHAERCEIHLSRDGGRRPELHLEIRDDGRGITEDSAPGVGMSSMRERAEELGGFFDVLAASDGGVLIRVELPLTDIETSGMSQGT
ncbi:MAG: histidine kinase [Anaerolineales bacterium]